MAAGLYLEIEPRISQGHVIKGSCDIIGGIPSREIIILPSLAAIDTFVIEVFVCCVIKVLYDFMIRSLSMYITILASLVVIDTAIVEI